METLRLIDRIREIIGVDDEQTDTSLGDIRMINHYDPRLRSFQMSINRNKMNWQNASGGFAAGGINRVGLSSRMR